MFRCDSKLRNFLLCWGIIVTLPFLEMFAMIGYNFSHQISLIGLKSSVVFGPVLIAVWDLFYSGNKGRICIFQFSSMLGAFVWHTGVAR
jgi:hypothetical protein